MSNSTLENSSSAEQIPNKILKSPDSSENSGDEHMEELKAQIKDESANKQDE